MKKNKNLIIIVMSFLFLASFTNNLYAQCCCWVDPNNNMPVYEWKYCYSPDKTHGCCVEGYENGPYYLGPNELCETPMPGNNPAPLCSSTSSDSMTTQAK